MTHRARHDTTTIPLATAPIAHPDSETPCETASYRDPPPLQPNPIPHRTTPFRPPSWLSPSSLLPTSYPSSPPRPHTAQPPAHLPSLLPVHRPISHRPLSTPPPRSGGPVQVDRRDAHTRARRLPGDRRHDDLPRRRDRGDCQPVPCTAIIKQGQLHYHATSAMCGISGTSDTSE